MRNDVLGRREPYTDGQRCTDSLRGKVQRVCVFRVGRFKPEKQAPVEDVHQLVYAVIPHRELDDLRLWLCGI